jgi:hypothetical protein
MVNLDRVGEISEGGLADCYLVIWSEKREKINSSDLRNERFQSTEEFLLAS